VGRGSDLTAIGAGELAAGIAARRFSSSEVVSAHHERQNQVESRINAVAGSLGDQAMAAARAADQGKPREGQ
jgi:Asp-tRNA(Asn)/Glu-tRNA(Gln) amidotransferase A subunit family amidase